VAADELVDLADAVVANGFSHWGSVAGCCYVVSDEYQRAVLTHENALSKRTVASRGSQGDHWYVVSSGTGSR
jgi:hypothetical protein